MRFLWQYLKKDWWLFLLAPALMALSVFCDLYLPTLMERVVDFGVLKQNQSIIYYYGSFMLLITAIGLISGALSFVISAKASGKTGEKLRDALYQKLLNLSYPEIDTFGVASLITRMTNDVSNVQNLLLSFQRTFISAPIMLFGGLFMTIYMAPSLSFIFYIAIPFTFGIIAFVAFKIAKTYPIVQKKLDKLNKSVREELLSIYVVKGFCREDYAKDNFDTANDDLYRWQLEAQKMMIALSPFLMIAFNYSMVAILWFGGYQVASGTINVGQIMAFLTYLSLILNAVITCSFFLITYARAKASIERIEEVIKTDITIPLNGTKTPKNYTLRFDKVSFSYPKSDNTALHDLSFDLAPGERLGIVGETGSGKSTILYLASHLYNPTSGTIYLDDLPLSEVDNTWLREHLHLIEQESTVLSGTLRDNLLISKANATEEELKEALITAQAKELLESESRGLEGGLNQRGTDLSGGQKQRLSIARALLGSPSYLFLDDATSALDALTEKAFLDALDKKTSLTQIIVSQRVSTLKRTDKILVLKDGTIEAIGSHNELLAISPTYKAIVASQLGEEV